MAEIGDLFVTVTVDMWIPWILTGGSFPVNCNPYAARLLANAHACFSQPMSLRLVLNFVYSVYDDNTISKFREFGFDIIQNSRITTHQVFAELERMSAEITSTELYSHATFPAVEYPYFSTITERTFNIVPTDVIDFSPIVKSSNRDEWETFASFNSTKSSNVDVTWDSSIHSGQGAISENETGPFVPLWETSSIDKGHEYRVTGLINFDLLTFTEFRAAFEWVQNRRRGALSEIITEFGPFWTFLGLEEEPGMTIDEFYQRTSPYVFTVQPVFDGLGVGEHEIVGVVTSMVPLSFSLQGSLDLGIVEYVHVVFRDACRNASYTYEVIGHKLSYLGPSDQHEPEFDELVINLSTNSTSTHQFTSQYESYYECPITLDVYPTRDLLLKYTTNIKWVVFGTVMGIFIFMFLVFCRYDVILQRRQRSLVKHAERNNTLLENFFPTNVHARLFDSGQGAKGIASEFQSRLAEVSNGMDPSMKGTQNDLVVNGMYTTKPIADLVSTMLEEFQWHYPLLL